MDFKDVEYKKKTLDESTISSRLGFISEYKYYTGELNEAPDDEEAPEEDAIEAGDDLEDEDMPEDEGGLELDGEAGDDLEGEIEDTLSDMGQDTGMPEEAGEEEVEIDVSEIVDGVNQNSESIQSIEKKIDSVSNQMTSFVDKLMKTNQSIANQVQNMGQNIEQEFRKRAPTPYENIHMRSLSSYPYNQKLTDFFKPAKGNEYEYSIDNPNVDGEKNDYQLKVKDSNEDETPEEYVLTNQDIEDDFNEIDVRNSL